MALVLTVVRVVRRLYVWRSEALLESLFVKLRLESTARG
jgi:hypothetical protein